jgi:hypothetical protein
MMWIWGCSPVRLAVKGCGQRANLVGADLIYHLLLVPPQHTTPAATAALGILGAQSSLVA